MLTFFVIFAVIMICIYFYLNRTTTKSPIEPHEYYDDSITSEYSASAFASASALPKHDYSNDEYKIGIPNVLAIKLFDKMDKNPIFSPLSIMFALSLIHLCAEQNTDKELTSFITHKHNPNELQAIQNTFNNNIIKMGNCIIINNKFKVNKKFTNSIKNFVLIEESDYSDKNAIANKVNDYIKTNTKGLIKNVLDKKDINNDTNLILINTIYFKANWLHKFNVEYTTKEKFGNTKKLVDMMFIEKKFNYYENDNMQTIEMFYNNKDYVMGVILPKNDEYKIDVYSLMYGINNLENTKVMLYLPKFTHRQRVNLIPILQNLGVNDLFDKDAAKLNIVEESYVTSIIHEAVVIVDEEGTEAAAVTTIMTQNCMAGPPTEKVIFRADHDFVYYIRHVPTNMILFYGEFCNM